MKGFIELVEEKRKAVAMLFGRMNPVTSGHEENVKGLHKLAHENNADHVVIASHTHDAKKNPLTPEQKLKHLKRAFPDTNVTVADKEAPTIMHHAARLHAQGYNHLIMAGGGDRSDEYHKLLHKYNGVKGAHGYYKFDKIESKSTGERKSGVSGTDMRNHASSGNYHEFRKHLPSRIQGNEKHAKELYNDTRSGMGIHESNDRGMFKAIFITGGPGSGKDIIIHDAIAESRITEIQVSQAYDFLNDKVSLSSPTKDHRLQSIQNRGPLIINGPTEAYEKMTAVKEELEELGYSTFMVFVNTTNEVSYARNHSLKRVMLEEVRNAKWHSAQEKIQYFYEMFDNFMTFDNNVDLNKSEPTEVALQEEQIGQVLHYTNRFLDSVVASPIAEDWMIRNRKVDINQVFIKEMISGAMKTDSLPLKLKRKGKTSGDDLKADGPTGKGGYDAVAGTYAESNFQQDKETAKAKKKRAVDDIPGKKINTDGLGASWDLRTNTGSGTYLGGIRAESKSFSKFRRVIESDYSPDVSGTDSAYTGNTGAMDKEVTQTYSDHKYGNLKMKKKVKK